MLTLAIGVLMLVGTSLFRRSRGSIESAEEKSGALRYAHAGQIHEA
jgi:hypothetical protein